MVGVVEEEIEEEEEDLGAEEVEEEEEVEGEVEDLAVVEEEGVEEEEEVHSYTKLENLKSGKLNFQQITISVFILEQTGQLVLTRTVHSCPIFNFNVYNLCSNIFDQNNKV